MATYVSDPARGELTITLPRKGTDPRVSSLLDTHNVVEVLLQPMDGDTAPAASKQDAQATGMPETLVLQGNLVVGVTPAIQAEHPAVVRLRTEEAVHETDIMHPASKSPELLQVEVREQLEDRVNDLDERFEQSENYVDGVIGDMQEAGRVRDNSITDLYTAVDKTKVSLLTHSDSLSERIHTEISHAKRLTLHDEALELFRKRVATIEDTARARLTFP